LDAGVNLNSSETHLHLVLKLSPSGKRSRPAPGHERQQETKNQRTHDDADRLPQVGLRGHEQHNAKEDGDSDAQRNLQKRVLQPPERDFISDASAELRRMARMRFPFNAPKGAINRIAIMATLGHANSNADIRTAR
jgi:hypothetical protein